VKAVILSTTLRWISIEMTDKLKQNALDYHRYPTPGKIRITPTKALTTQEDLGLAYTPKPAI